MQFSQCLPLVVMQLLQDTLGSAGILCNGTMELGGAGFRPTRQDVFEFINQCGDITSTEPDEVSHLKAHTKSAQKQMLEVHNNTSIFLCPHPKGASHLIVSLCLKRDETKVCICCRFCTLWGKWNTTIRYLIIAILHFPTQTVQFSEKTNFPAVEYFFRTGLNATSRFRFFQFHYL